MQLTEKQILAVARALYEYIPDSFIRMAEDRMDLYGAELAKEVSNALFKKYSSSIERDLFLQGVILCLDTRRCECGAHVAKSPFHSDWCPLYGDL